MTFEQTSPEFKKAAIDWLLAHGDHDSMTSSLRSALADLAVRGVDYEDSDLPMMQTVDLTAGDTFNEGTRGMAFAATIKVRDRDRDNWRDGHYEFFVPQEDMVNLLISNMILGVLAAADAGDAAWRARVDERAYAEAERLRDARQRWRAQQEAEQAAKSKGKMRA